jgi:choline kinase
MNEIPAVILAAGCGKRMGPEGLLKPKTLTKIGNRCIVDMIMESLSLAGISTVVFASGHKADILEKYLRLEFPQFKLYFVRNERYDQTNNIYSLWLAREYLQNGFYLIEADVCYDKTLLQKLQADANGNVMAVDAFNQSMNGTVVSLNKDDSVKRMFLTTKSDTGFDYAGKYKTVNIYKFGASYCEKFFLNELDHHIANGNVNSYYEAVIKKNIDDGAQFHAFKMGSLKWWEIDTPEDVAIAQRLFHA